MSMEKREKYLIGGYVICVIAIIGMLWCTDTFARLIRDLSMQTLNIMKYAGYAYIYRATLIILICLLHFIGRYIKTRIYVGGILLIILIQGIYLYGHFTSIFSGYRIMVYFVFVVEFIFTLIGHGLEKRKKQEVDLCRTL